MKSKLLWLLPVAIAAFALLFLSGCNDTDKPSTDPGTNQPSPKPNTPYRREKIEPMDESTGELSRRHIYDELDREVETQINYRNGESATHKYREDGSTKEYVLRAKGGALKQRKVFDIDGKTVIEGLESRSDGTTKWTMEKLPDGSTKTVTYWYDGKRVFSEEIKKPNGTWQTTYFRKSGKVWVKKSGTGSKTEVEDQFDRNGLQTSRTEFISDSKNIVTVYNNGKPEARQTWRVERNSWSGTYQTLEEVEELDASGKVTRKLTMDGGGWDVKQTETFNPDGTRVVRTLRYDGTISKEETFDKSGKSTNVKEYKDDERTTEKIDRQLLRRSYPDDAYNSWNLQEYYPYYRDRDE